MRMMMMWAVLLGTKRFLALGKYLFRELCIETAGFTVELE
jgi:hypothetical protein